MSYTYEYKKQGDGTDSWVAIETNDKGIVVNKYMVYEDPFKSDFIKMLEKASIEDLKFLKNKLASIK